MEGFCFFITDKTHNVYYASGKTKELLGSDIQNKNCFQCVSYPETSIFQKFVESDIDNQGFFNGYMRLGTQSDYFFCDYGKRFDNNGNYIGHEGIMYSVPNELSDYMEHFYNNFENKAASAPNLSMLDIYLEEQQLIAKNMNTSFAEFMLALQEEHDN